MASTAVLCFSGLRMPQKFTGQACTPNTRTINFKKTLEDYSGLLFSTVLSRLKKTREDYYSGLLFSTGQKVHLKREVKTTAVYFSVQQ